MIPPVGVLLAGRAGRCPQPIGGNPMPRSQRTSRELYERGQPIWFRDHQGRQFAGWVMGRPGPFSLDLELEHGRGQRSGAYGVELDRVSHRSRARSNPGGVDPLALEARDRYREDMRAGHTSAAEYWRGQAGALFTGGHQRAVQANPLLAIVGNPRGGYQKTFDYGSTPHRMTGKQVVALMRKRKVTIAQLAKQLQVSQKRVREVRGRGITEGQGYVYDWIEAIDRASSQRQVAGAGSSGRVKAKESGTRRVEANRTMPRGKKKKREKTKRVPLQKAQDRFDGYDEALTAYTKFHGSNPGYVELHAIDDGRDEVTVDRVHAALHRTLETNYVVPWKGSNKHGTLWLHEHKEGAGLRGLQKGVQMPNPDDLPLEVYDPATKTTRKIGGRFKISDWWYD